MTDQTPPADRPTGTGDSRHPEIDELAAYADGDLRAGDRERVADHLAGCAECNADIAALEGTSEALASLGPVTMPADVAQRLDHALSALSEPSRATTVLPARTRRGGAGWATGAAAAAVVALVAAVGLASIKGGGSDKDRAATSATGLATASAPGPRMTSSGTNYSASTIRGQLQAYVAQQGIAPNRAPQAAAAAPSTEAMAAATESAPAAQDSQNFAGSSSAAKSSAAPPELATADKREAQQELAALQADETRLAACIVAVTGGETVPLALDFAEYDGQPALAIVLPHRQPEFVSVNIVGPKCGQTSDANFLRLEVVPIG